MGLRKKKNKKLAEPGESKPAKSPLEIVEPFSTTPSYTNRKKEPVFAREGSVSSNKSSGSEQKKAPGHTRTVSAGAAVQRSSSIKTESRNKQNNVPVEPTRTNSVGASSSASSTASSVRALPAEFPAPSNTTLQMTLEELIKTARVCKIPKTKRGYGFHVKGLAEKKKEFTPSVEAPCSQFMFGVDQDSESCKAGVLPDDFIYKVNGKDVSVASHKEVVELIKKSGDPLHLSLIQVSKNLPVQAPTPATAATPTASPAATPTAVAPPPAVPKRDPKTRLKGPRLSLSTRSNTISGPVTNNAENNGEESIYDNIKRPTATVPASAESESSRPPPPPAPAPAFVPRKLERMNSAPGGAARADGYKRSNTMPVKPPSSIKEEQKKEEAVQMVPVLPHNTAAELQEQRKRLTSIQHGSDNQSLGSLQSTQSEPPKVSVSRSPDNRPLLDEPPIAKSKSAEDIARKAAEMRKKRGSVLSGGKVHNYDLPPPPTVIPPPPPPDDLPPPPPAVEPVSAPPPPPPPSEPASPAEPAPPSEPTPPSQPEPEKKPKETPVVSVTPVVTKQPEVKPEVKKEPDADKDDNDSYDSGFIQNGKHVEDWEAADVAEWLTGLGLGEYKDIFLENDISGPNLLDLTKADLKELGVTKLGHRITLTKEIKSRLSEGR